MIITSIFLRHNRIRPSSRGSQKPVIWGWRHRSDEGVGGNGVMVSLSKHLLIYQFFHHYLISSWMLLLILVLTRRGMASSFWPRGCLVYSSTINWGKNMRWWSLRNRAPICRNQNGTAFQPLQLLRTTMCQIKFYDSLKIEHKLEAENVNVEGTEGSCNWKCFIFSVTLSQCANKPVVPRVSTSSFYCSPFFNIHCPSILPTP